MSLQKNQNLLLGLEQYLKLSRHELENHAVQNLPQEIVDMILLSLLSISDRICFSLTCKYLFSCFQSFLYTKNAQLSKLLPREERVMLTPNAEKRERNNLLHRLANDRWEFCNH